MRGSSALRLVNQDIPEPPRAFGQLVTAKEIATRYFPDVPNGEGWVRRNCHVGRTRLGHRTVLFSTKAVEEWISSKVEWLED